MSVANAAGMTLPAGSAVDPAADPAAAHGAAHHQDYEGDKTGMWLFLFTEFALFAALFVIYGVYRIIYTPEFHHAAANLNVAAGVTNTVILLTSSLTMVLAVNALQRGENRRSMALLWATMALALAFMVIKYFEWGAKFEHGLYPGSEHLLAMDGGEIVFFGLYFVMTGLHGIHVLLGVGAMLFLLPRIKSGRQSATNYTLTENVGLYWHLVDVIWIFLLPLFYLTN